MTDITLAGITLPGDLYWSDEFTAWKVGQARKTSLTGALILHVGALQTGRPITLETNRKRPCAAACAPPCRKMPMR